ncbi:hypothetical protein B0H14DRAFT_1175757 [Mycena olivaceomarginata]|nr:hypothetical protein B0H14DRAFT_1175757 [Mycena olivaceomarginata]
MRRPTNHHTPPRSDYAHAHVFAAQARSRPNRSATLVIHPSAVDVFCPLQLIHRRAPPRPRHPPPRPLWSNPIPPRLRVVLRPFHEGASPPISCSDLPHRDAPACVATPRSRLTAPSPPSRHLRCPLLALIAALCTPHLSLCHAPPHRQTVPPSLPSPLRAGA